MESSISSPMILPAWQDYTTYRLAQGVTEPSVVGDLKILPDLWSPQCHNQRDILAYLPPSYNYTNRTYPVLYMHDGQNLFDQKTSFAGEWRVDESMEILARERIEAIIVGIPNRGDERLAEYSPFPDHRLGGGHGKQYLAFLIDTVKPLVDQTFRTQRDPEYTGIIGSSMGGLISLYAFFRHAEIFGLAGVMSTSLWFAKKAIFNFVKTAPYNPGKLYMDTGTHEYDGHWQDQFLFRVASRRHCARNRRMVNLLRRRGYSRTQLHYCEAQGAGHSETAWADRFPGMVRFLFQNQILDT